MKNSKTLFFIGNDVLCIYKVEGRKVYFYNVFKRWLLSIYTYDKIMEMIDSQKLTEIPKEEIVFLYEK